MSKLVDVICIGCNKSFKQELKSFNRAIKFRQANQGSEKGLYCTLQCFKATLGIRLSAAPNMKCAICKVPIHIKPFRKSDSISKVFTCSKECKAKAMSVDTMLIKMPHTKDGRHDYRKRAFKVKPLICEQCGYSKFADMLDVDHIDGNRSNNKITNLEILCVWCHALKTRSIPFHLPALV